MKIRTILPGRQITLWLSLLLMMPPVALAGKYDVANIPEHLKENAIAVIRENHQVFDVSNENRARYTERLVITILERRGEALADLRVHYDSFRRVRNYKGTLYDAKGNKIRDLRRNEFIDQSATSSFSLYDDNRLLYTDIYRSQFPFTVEFEYELEYRKGFFVPDWVPQYRSELAIENSTFTIITPNGIDYRYQAYNAEGLEPLVETDSRRTTRRWALENTPAIKSEPYMPSFRRLAPYLMVGSNQFRYDGNPGSMSTWQDYGRWIAGLNRGRQNLPQETRARVQELVAGVDDPLEKVRIIYEFMQARTRYVSIQLGIGGLQPFDAATVDRNGYGDCKALVNYTQALLQEAGINSYYTLVYMGSSSYHVKPDFPNKAFNHVILCVPLEQDTLWLECTSNHFPVGFIGSDNSNRYVLLITPEGGKLTRTPRYEHAHNHRERSIQVKLLANGNVEFWKQTWYRGLRYEDRLGLSLQGPAAQRRHLQQNLGINNPEIVELSFEQDRQPNPVLTEQLQVKTNQYVSRAGNRILFQPSIMTQMGSAPAVMANRVHPVQLGASGLYTDTVAWELPAGFSVTHIPEAIQIDNEFGYFSNSYEVKDNQLIFQRAFYTRWGIHPPEKYPDFVEFFRTVHNADRAQVIISRD
jgi:hypothetical protein